jgi:carboxypeptidase family protein
MSTTLPGADGCPADFGGHDGRGGPPVYGHVRQAHGVPVSGATITLIDMSGRQAGRNRTGADGAYKVRVSRPGMYNLIAMAPAHRPQAEAVHVGGGPVEHDVLLTGAAGLAGTVRAAGSCAPVSGATITLADSLGEVLETRGTDDAGQYLFQELTAGQYTLAVTAPSYQPSALPVTVTDGTQTTVDAELCGLIRVEGTVRGIRGTGVADARVTLLDPAGDVAAGTMTGPDGRYAFENLSEGDYTMIASGYAPTASTLRITSGHQDPHDMDLGYLE